LNLIIVVIELISEGKHLKTTELNRAMFNKKNSKLLQEQIKVLKSH